MGGINKCTWETIIQNGWYKEVAPFYSKEFPVEIRSMLSDWLSRDNSFMSFNLDEDDHRKCALAFVEALLHELWNRINASSSEGDANFHHKQRLLKLYDRVQALERLHLYKVIRDTLGLEKQCVEELCTGKASRGTNQSQKPGTSDRSFSQIQEEINSVLTYIQLKCQEIDYKIPEMGNTLQTWKYNCYRLSQSQQNLVNGSTNVYEMDPIPSEEELRNQNSKLSTDMRTLYELVVEVMGLLYSSVHEKVLKELEKWRDSQRLVTLGKPTANTLEVIEKWFKIMGSCFTILEQRLPEFMLICQEQNLTNEANSIRSAIERIENLRQAMINVSLVISKEPKQIIRTGPNFGPIRLNVLPFSTNIMITAVKAVFINEKTANEYFSNPNQTHQELPLKCGDLKYTKSDPRYNKNQIEYQTVTVTKVSKNAKRGEQFVVQEKFWIYFRVTVSYKKKSIFVRLYTTSLPISVTSHPVQEGKAWAHVVWYNAFPLKMRQRFDVPEFIHWSKLIETINYPFLALGKGLTDEQKNYLKLKIFKGDVQSSEMVNKRFFVSDIIATVQPDPNKPEDEKSVKQYTYGEWLHCCLKLISWVPKNGKFAEYGVRKFWSEGKIIGFMSKEEIESRLRGCAPGTFILRFPENRPENICLYFHDPSVDSKDHLLKQLLSINDFKTKTLQDRILDNPAAVYLYPKTPKKDAFTKMSKSDCSTVDGYFNVDMQENIPAFILQKIKKVQVATDVFSPCSSHSALSYGVANSPAESVQSDHSSTTGSFTAYSPYGIDPRIMDQWCEQGRELDDD